MSYDANYCNLISLQQIRKFWNNLCLHHLRTHSHFLQPFQCIASNAILLSLHYLSFLHLVCKPFCVHAAYTKVLQSVILACLQIKWSWILISHFITTLSQFLFFLFLGQKDNKQMCFMRVSILSVIIDVRIYYYFT